MIDPWRNPVFLAGRTHAQTGGLLSECPYSGGTDEQLWRDGYQDFMAPSAYSGLPAGMGPSPSEELEMIEKHRRELRRSADVEVDRRER